MALKCMVALPDNAVLTILTTPLDHHCSTNLNFDNPRQNLEIVNRIRTSCGIAIRYGIIDIFDLAAYEICFDVTIRCEK